MSHLHTNPGEHDHTVSMYIINDKTEPRILLHKHRKLNIWLQFGGHIELDETPWQAVAHELQEETGYELQQMKVLQPSYRLRVVSDVTLHPLPTIYNTHVYGSKKDGHRHTDVGYILVTNQEPKRQRDKNESDELQAFTAKQLTDFADKALPANVRDICLYALGLFKEGDQSWELVSVDEFSLNPPSPAT